MTSADGAVLLDPVVHAAVRELASQLSPTKFEGIKLRQAQIVSIQNNLTCSCYIDGDTVTPIPGITWLVDAMCPSVGVLYWMLDGGPGARFLIGTSEGGYFNDTPNNGSEEVIEMSGLASRTNNNTSWPDSLWSGGVNLPVFNLSPAGAATAELRFLPRLHKYQYTVTVAYQAQTNMGKFAVTIQGGPDNKYPNEVQIGADIDCYNATVGRTVLTLGTVNIDTPGAHTIRFKKLGTKNAASTDYYVAFGSLTFSPTGIIHN